MAIAGELINVLGFKLTGEDNLRKFNKGMNDAEQSSKRSAESTRKHAAAAGIAATAAIATIGAGFKNFAEFERQMNRIGITAGAGAAAVGKASEAVQRMANDFAMPLDQAVSGLDTLVASGMSLEQAMAFLPSVLATAQAAGAATEDIANTAIKASSALGIEAGRMQAAFDIMVAGGKAGQFELKDMASFIPNLANSFANLGYEGEEGLQKLIAILQTLRTSTGDAGTAATAAGEIFGKMFAPEVVKNFDELGVNIKEQMAEAKAAGEDLMKAYVRISTETMKANPKATLVDLFSDKQMRDGMLTLMKMGDAWRDFDEAVTSSDVAGGTMRDLGVVLEDNAAKIQRMSNSWDQFSKAVGAAAAGPLGTVMDGVTNFIGKSDAIDVGLEKRGIKKGSAENATWRARNLWGEERERVAREGGYAPTASDRAVREAAPDAYRVLGRMPARPQSTVGRGGPQREMMDTGASTKALFDQLSGINQNLATMAAEASGSGITAPITDARQDNRQFPVNVGGVVVNVASPDSAPAATGAAVGNAIGKSAVSPASRIEMEPSQP